MKLAVTISPDLARLMAAEIEAGEQAVSTAMRGAALDLKQAWRGQITGAGLGRKLANTIRSDVFPRNTPSLSAAALVRTTAPKIVGAHEAGPLIRSADGFYLAIPTEAAGRGLRGKRLTPGEWERRTGLRLRFVYRRSGPSLLVADAVRISARGTAAVSRSKTGRGQATVPIFVLVPQVKLKKRINLDGPANAAQAGLPDRIVRAWIDRKVS